MEDMSLTGMHDPVRPRRQESLASPARRHWGTCPSPLELAEVHRVGSFYIRVTTVDTGQW